MIYRWKARNNCCLLVMVVVGLTYMRLSYQSFFYGGLSGLIHEVRETIGCHISFESYGELLSKCDSLS